MATRQNVHKYSVNKPLLQTINNGYASKCEIQYNQFEVPKEFNLYDAVKGIKLPEKDYKLVFGIKGKPEQFETLDFLWCFDGPAFVVHQRVLDKLNELCPNDIQALPVTIKNLEETAPKFVNRTFYLINILKLADIFDKKYVLKRGERAVPKLSLQVFNDNCMHGALLARDYVFVSRVFFHPSLAKHFKKSKGTKFLTQEQVAI